MMTRPFIYAAVPAVVIIFLVYATWEKGFPSKHSNTNNNTSLAPKIKQKPEISNSNCNSVICNPNEKRVVSFGLYGSDPRYTTGALHNAELVKYILPGWVCRFYVDETVPADTITALKAEGAEIHPVSSIKGGIAGMFWRFLVADDDTVDRYVVRDADSRLSMRERMAIEEWITSGKAFHIIRDHPNHNYRMNGGLWGGTKGALGAKISSLMDGHGKHNYLEDMNFLGNVIWPRIENNQIAHDSYHCKSYPNSHPFPTRRINREIVGAVYSPDDVPRAGDADVLRESPVECRKKPTWTMG